MQFDREDPRNEPTDTPHTIQDEDVDADRLAALWSTYHRRLSAYVHRHAPDLDADDVASAVLESALAARRRGHASLRTPRAYLFTAVRRRIARERSLSSHLSSLDDGALERLLAESEQPTASPEGQALVESLLGEYSPRDRFLLVERFGHEASISSIAAATGLTEPQTSRRLYKVKLDFRSRWIQSHVTVPDRPEICSKTLRQTGRVLSGLAAPSVAEKFWSHVDSCPNCSAAVRESRESTKFPYLLFVGIPIAAFSAQQMSTSPAAADPQHDTDSGTDDMSSAIDGGTHQAQLETTLGGSAQTTASHGAWHSFRVVALLVAAAGLVVVIGLSMHALLTQPDAPGPAVPSSSDIVPSPSASADGEAQPEQNPARSASPAPTAETHTGTQPPEDSIPSDPGSGSAEPTPSSTGDGPLQTCSWSSETMCFETR
ncbi:hypothetical protein F8O06_05660 [Pseudoclavibacter sp. CFCC 14310]|nr:hypothetical protein F8O06_05660 [Pseudoclavibacter sp. CFCC 14310]